MSEANRFGPEPIQVVSDLAQLSAFIDPQKMRILRILQQQEATTSQIAAMTDQPVSTVSDLVSKLNDVRLIKEVGQRDGDDGPENVYRAVARIFSLRPEPGNDGIASAMISPAAMAATTLDSVSAELVSSLTTWPDQWMNYEGRRTRMSHERLMEFNDKLVELIAEYWGDPDHPVKEDPDDPLMALIGFWYRFPEQEKK